MGDLLGTALGSAAEGPARGAAPDPGPRPRVDLGRLRGAYSALIGAAEPAVREGTADTPARAARAWVDLTAGYDVDVRALLRCFPAEGHDEMVVVRSIPFYSLCEHHLLPFHGEAHVGYIPNGKIVGLSKVARLVDAYARRLQVQERLTDQVADALERHVQARGVIVVVKAEHLCMSMRGVEKPGSITVTSVVRGILKEDPRARAEALDLMR